MPACTSLRSSIPPSPISTASQRWSSRHAYPGHPSHVGITVASDTFYPGQERYDTVSGYVRRSLQGSAAEWAALHVLNYEMESATLFTMCSANGWRAGMVAGVLVNRTQQEIPDEAVHDRVEANAVAVVVEAARRLAG